MPTQAELAYEHQASRIVLADQTASDVVGLWRQADVAFLDASWGAIAPFLVDAVAESQVQAASRSVPYTRNVPNLDASSSVLVPEAFSGVTGDGREVGPALFNGVTTTKSLIGSGLSLERAFSVGAALMAVITKAAVADAGREADRVAATGRGYTFYERVLSPGACSRCAILAGVGEYSKPFQRHPACKCTSWPVQGPGAKDLPDGLFSSPSDYFESLSVEEQNRVFTNDGAQAIRDGADPISVVNARRGAYSTPARGGTHPPFGYRNGKPVRGYTSEGTTIRGAFGRAEYRRTQEASKAVGDRYRRSTTRRLMPEGIYVQANGDREKAVELFKYYGYMN